MGVDENLTDSWTPGAKDFLPKKKKFQPKPKKAKKKPCSESQQNTGKQKGAYLAYLAIFGIFGCIFGRVQYGQVGCPWKDLEKCSSDKLVLGQ